RVPRPRGRCCPCAGRASDGASARMTGLGGCYATRHRADSTQPRRHAMKPLRIGDVSISKVIELDRSATPIGFMLPDSTPERIAAQRDWLGPELGDPVTGAPRPTLPSYAGRTPRHTVPLD